MSTNHILHGLTLPLSFLLSVETGTLGRSSKGGFVVKHDTVSRLHAELAVVPGGVRVQDLESKNGTFVDNQRVSEPVIAATGQRLRFGEVEFLLMPSPLANVADVGSEVDTGRCDLLSGASIDPVTLELSEAQLRVLPLVRKGFSDEEIAKQLHRSPHTVHKHVQVIRQKLGVHTRAELVYRLSNS